MNLKPVYRLKHLSEEAVLIYSDPENPYERIEDHALYWKGRMCIEHYYSEKGPDFDIIQTFYLFEREDTQKLIEKYGSLEKLYDALKATGIKSASYEHIFDDLGVKPIKMIDDNPFKEGYVIE